MLHSTTQIVALEAKAPIARKTRGINSGLIQKEKSKSNTVPSLRTKLGSDATRRTIPSGNSLAREIRPSWVPTLRSQDPLLQASLARSPQREPPSRSLSSGSQDYRDRSWFDDLTSLSLELYKLWQAAKFRDMTVTKIQTAVGSLDRQFANRIPCRGLDPRRIYH